MKVLAASDLHLCRSLYRQLADAVAKHKPDLLALAGDFLNTGEPHCDMLTADEAARLLASLDCETVMVRGNHEDETWPVFEDAWKATGEPLHPLHGSAARFGQLTVIGFPCWMGFDMYYATGRELDDYRYEEWLPQLMRAEGRAGRALWLMHEPPCLDLSEGWLCNPEWEEAIERYRPLAVLCGHDHKTPLKTGKWLHKIGDSQCVNVGQRVYPKPGRLLYCTLDFAFAPDGAPRLAGRIRRHG